MFLFVATTTSFSQEKDSVLNAIDTVENNNKYAEAYEKKEEVKVLFNAAKDDTSPVVARFLVNDTIQRLRKKEEYQYPNLEQQKKNNKSSNRTGWVDFFRAFAGSTAKFILWTIIIGFMVVVIVLYALDNNIRIFSRKAKKIAIVEEEVSFNNIFNIDYVAEIKNAVNSHNFNMAARLGFLQLLTLLNNKKLIDYGIEKTNFDYQFQLLNTKYYKDFMLSAHNYEYSWYSGYKLNANQYKQIAQYYKNLEAQL